MGIRVDESPVIPLLVGPTGTGKSRLSLELAQIIGGEIVNADSRQVYSKMDIGTAKPNRAERALVPHHLFDCLQLSDHISAGRFLELASTVFEDVFQRGKVPVVVGGSTLYTYALTHGLADIPHVDSHVRLALEDRARQDGYDVLYQELLTVDPISASSMDATKSQRIIRALEVYYGTGQPLSSYHEKRTRLPYRFSLFILDRPRELLYQRIDARVDMMLESGLVEEVSALRDGGANDNLYPLRSPGYKEVISFLREEIDRPEMVRLIKRNTRRYAKRQLTWYRRYDESLWIDATATATEVAESIEDHVLVDGA